MRDSIGSRRAARTRRLRAGPPSSVAAVDRDALAHADEPVAAGAVAVRGADAVVVIDELDRAVDVADDDVGVRSRSRA